MSYEDRNDFIMLNEMYDFNQLNHYNHDYNYDYNQLDNYNNIEFRDTIIINNEFKDMLDLDDLINSFIKMHI